MTSSSQSANQRVAALFRSRLHRPITRAEIVAAAGPGQKDPLKRVRANGGARDILRAQGLEPVWLGGDDWTCR
jgi:hypothetical protein